MFRLLLPWLLCTFALTVGAAPRVEDSLSQRTLACTSCHGKEGRAGPDGYYPRLAGKPAGYLYHQLLHFRDGRRHYGLMSALLEPLSDQYLFEIARHFSVQQLPYPRPQPAAAPPEVLQRGRQLALHGDPEKRLPACAGCHGQALTGVEPVIPGLLGLPRDYLNAQLGAWRTGQRRAHAPDCMAEIARRLAPEDLLAVTAWLAAEPVPGQGKPAAAAAEPAPAARKGARNARKVASAPAPAPPMVCGSVRLPSVP